MTAHREPLWTPPTSGPRPPPKGDINSLPWVPEPAKPLVFINANVVDVASNNVHEGMTVRIEKGHFASVKKSVAAELLALSKEKGVRVVDLNGLWLCPGLVDCHVHINMSDGGRGTYVDPHLRATYTLRSMLARGFTTVRDVGGATFFQKEAVEQWLTPGPRLFQGGRLLSQTGGHGDARGREVPASAPSLGCCSGDGPLIDGVASAAQITRELMRQGADHIKIATSGGVSSPTDKLDSIQFLPEEIRTISQVCADMGGRLTTAHAYTPAAIRRAVENGVRGIEHGNLIDRPTAKLLKETGTFLTPTLIISTCKGRPPLSDSLPEWQKEKNEQVRLKGREAIKIAEEEGVTVCFGTDLTFGMGYLQSEEFTIRAELLPSHKVLAHATVNAAKQLGDDKIGKIEEGAYGDCLVLPHNPLVDVRVLDSGPKGIWAVVKEGRVVIARESVAEQVELDVVLGVPDAE